MASFKNNSYRRTKRNIIILWYLIVLFIYDILLFILVSQIINATDLWHIVNRFVYSIWIMQLNTMIPKLVIVIYNGLSI